MPFSAFDPVDEDRSNNDAVVNQQKLDELLQTVTPDVAQRASDIYRRSPYMPAKVVLAMAKAGTSQAAVDAAAKAAAVTTAKKLDPNKKDDRGWFSKYVGDNFKAATRWTFAGLSLVPDLAQNLGAEVFSSNDPEGMDGWFKSTQLGTLIADSDKAGSGFFMGGEAANLQAERARRYRGTVNGHAWTIGRGAAQLAFTPGSKAYNVLSGFIDASVQVVADPSTYVGGKIKDVVKARSLIQGLEGAEELATFGKVAERGLAGLSAAEQATYDGAKFTKWVKTSGRATRLTERIVNTATNANLSKEDKVLKILKDFDFKISPNQAELFAEADDVAKVHGILGMAASRLDVNPNEVLLPKYVSEIHGAKWSTAFDDAVSERVPLWQSLRKNRYFATMPENTIVANGSGLDKANAIRNYSNYLRGVGIAEDSDQYKNVMRVVTKAYSTTDVGASRKAAQGAFDMAMEEIMQHAGLEKKNAQAVAKVLAQLREEGIQSRAYSVIDGVADDGGMVQGLRAAGIIDDADLADLPPHLWDDLVLTSPGSLAELANDLIVLPDFRKLRRATGMLTFGKYSLTGTAAGEAKGVLAATEFVQQEIWKPLQLATGGYIMRNMFDAQTRIAMNGLSGFFNHPIDFIQWSFFKKGFGDIKGDIFDEELAKLVDGWDTSQKEFREAMNFAMYRHLQDPVAAKEKLLRNGNWSLVSRGNNPDVHTTGYIDNLGLIYGDLDIERRVAQLTVQGYNQPERVRIITDYLNSAAGAEAKEQLTRYLREGIKFSDPKTGQYGFVAIPESKIEDTIGYWVENLASKRVEGITRGDRELSIVAGFNRVPLPEPATKVMASSLDPNDFVTGKGIPVDGGVGTLVFTDKDDVHLLVTRRWMQGADEMVELQPVVAGDAIEAYRGSKALRRLIDEKGYRGELAETVKRAERGVSTDKNMSPALKRSMEAKNKATDFFFHTIYGSMTQKLERSPVFRQYYYQEILDVADGLSPAEAQRVVDSIVSKATAEGIKPERYVGDKKILEKLRKVAGSQSAATGTLEDLDAYAKAVALRSTKELLYNATERSNLEDIFRVIVPFGGAWKEVMGTYAKALIEDPRRVRRAQLIFDAGRKFDPDGDGQGFFYKDPTTGEYSFNFPMSGELSQLLTGMNVPLQAPVKRISIGLGVFPSVGPVGQIAASKIIPDTPSTDWISKIIFPYGRDQGLDLQPKWVGRIREAWAGDTKNLQTVYGNTYIETLRALSATGEYDLSVPAEQEKLFADARQKARVLTGLRALGQFIGPTSPAPEFKIETLQGDVYGTQLVKEFQKLQDPNSIGVDGAPGNYDTAVQRFLEIYGNDAILYISNKTESVKGGLEASKQFGDWERRNSRLMEAYPDVAGFMAPGGDDFSFEVWSRQVRKGDRRRLTDRELVELAQYRAASAQYRAMRDKLDAFPSQAQKQWLRDWRKALNKEYPGFPVVAEFNPGEFPAKIEQMKRMVEDPDLADNDVAQALKQYLEARDKAYAQAGAGGYQGIASVAATGIRDWLAAVGRSLVKETPEFGRIYDRLLSSEVEE